MFKQFLINFIIRKLMKEAKKTSNVLDDKLVAAVAIALQTEQSNLPQQELMEEELSKAVRKLKANIKKLKDKLKSNEGK